MKRHRSASALALLLTTAAAIGCAEALQAADPPPPGAQATPPVLLTVENQDWSDVTVYMLVEDLRVRLGVVPSFTMRRFELPPIVSVASTDVRLLAEPAGSRLSYLTSRISAEPGDQIVWRVDHRLAEAASLWRRAE